MIQLTTDKTVKLIGTKRYEIELLETKYGWYYIKYEIRGNKVNFISPLYDFNIASSIFNEKYDELEGI